LTTLEKNYHVKRGAVLLKLQPAIQRHRLKIRGAIHVGAHYGEEYKDYIEAGITNVVFIEPCTSAMEVLKQRFSHVTGVTLFHCALGAEERRALMYVETSNRGQSNSLLHPRLHLERYPEIQFHNREEVQLRKLDNLPIDRIKYNLLTMDVQGYEKFVLQGGMKTLENIDCVYTEVNCAELYEDCTRVEELDQILYAFHRVQTWWAEGKDWGDAIYVRRQLAESLAAR
jgi:FkbM family methyltransferase